MLIGSFDTGRVSRSALFAGDATTGVTREPSLLMRSSCGEAEFEAAVLLRTRNLFARVCYPQSCGPL